MKIAKYEKKMIAFLNRAETKLEFTFSYSKSDTLHFLQNKNKRRGGIDYGCDTKAAKKILKKCFQLYS